MNVNLDLASESQLTRDRGRGRHFPERGGSLPASRPERRTRITSLTTDLRPARTNTPWTILLTTLMMGSGGIPAKNAPTVWCPTVADVSFVEIRKDTEARI